jgi:hypothetical protein
MNYVTLADLKDGLKITESDEDAHLERRISAASARIRAHLGDNAPDLAALASGSGSGSGSGSSAQAAEDAFDLVQVATIHLVGLMHQAGVADQSGFDGKGLPPIVKTILNPLREPPLA